MPRKEVVVRILVASPSDTQDERDTVDDVVAELNATWATHSGVRLETVRWERDSRPGIGSDPQNVINAQISDNYDILVCMFWLKWGTLTPRGTSGTEDEFRLGLARYREDPSSVRIMVYFKDTPVAPSQIDWAAYERVAAFRAELGALGILYALFSGTEDLAGLLRMHLSKEVQSFVDIAQPGIGPPATQLVPIGDASEAEEGYFDLIERGVDRSQEAEAIIVRMSEATEVLGKRIVIIASALSEASINTSRESIEKVRGHIDEAAAELSRYAERIEDSLPPLRVAYADSMEAYGQAAALMVELVVDPEKKRPPLEESLSVLQRYAESMTEARSYLAQLRETIRAMPRLTTYLNRAKKRALAALDGLTTELDMAVSQAKHTRQVIEDMVSG